MLSKKKQKVHSADDKGGRKEWEMKREWKV